MIFICKEHPPESFEKWKRENHREKFDALSKNQGVKRELIDSLIAEQKGLCCYCCASVSRENSHIEHVKPKSNSKYRNLRFSYTNLLASCNGYDDYGFTCGHNKHEWYDEDLFISPLDEGCESRLSYSLDGKIMGANRDDRGAAETISRLFIDSYELRNARRAVIDSVLFGDKSIYDNLDREIEMYKVADKDGRLTPFVNAIIFALEYLRATE